MVASFVPATVIITGNNYTTTSEPNRTGIRRLREKAWAVYKIEQIRDGV
jgi:hypothetical protein